ncbi:MAG: methyltransferase domain-containing protein [Myxococcales bacterium]|nr:methyltransferase domain-containing protein [Myxococcales bacterium]
MNAPPTPPPRDDARVEPRATEPGARGEPDEVVDPGEQGDLDALADLADLADLAGAPLIAALRRRFAVLDRVEEVAGKRWRILRPRDPAALIDDAAFERDGRIPYWAELWPSASILAERLQDAPRAAPGAPRAGGALLELGAGVGLVSLVAQAAGYRALATDYYGDALAFARANAWLNGQGDLAIREVDWRALPADLPRFDLVVAADVLYEPAHAELIAATIDRALAPGGLALVADPERPTAAGFPAACAAHGLAIERSTTTRGEGEARRSISLYALRRPW